MSETGLGETGLTVLQLDYSTADIEKMIFFGVEQVHRPMALPFAPAKILVVNGEMHLLEEEGSIDG